MLLRYGLSNSHSVYPIFECDPDIPSQITSKTSSLSTRVYLSKPTAYSLQLYESIDRPAPPAPPAGDTQLTPDSDRYSSFSSSAPSTLEPMPATMSASVSTCAGDLEPTRPRPSREKRYAVYLQYTKRTVGSRDKSNEVMMLAPAGS